MATNQNKNLSSLFRNKDFLLLISPKKIVLPKKVSFSLPLLFLLLFLLSLLLFSFLSPLYKNPLAFFFSLLFLRFVFFFPPSPHAPSLLAVSPLLSFPPSPFIVCFLRRFYSSVAFPIVFLRSWLFFFFLEVLQCWSLVLQLCAFFPHLLQRRGSSIALCNISTTLLQRFCNILLLSFFFFSACARDYSDFLHRNTLSHISL